MSITTTEGYFNNDITERLSNDLYQENLNTLLKSNMDDAFKSFVTKSFDQLVLSPRKKWAPHINGWYYANMVHGSWAHDMMDTTKKLPEIFTEFSPDNNNAIKSAIKEMGHLIKEIDPTQLNIEYETVSGRVRNIQHATRAMGTSDMSITFKDNRNLDNFRYHEIWYKYIDAYKKGFFDTTLEEDPFTSPFIPVPYLNAIWVVIFKPLSFELQGLIKIMGIAPTGLPIKDIIGQRSSPQVTTYSINYKAVDTICVFYGDSKPSGNFYEDFLADAQTFF